MGMVETTLEIDAAVQDCFDGWICLECLTCFLTSVETGYCDDNNQLYWHWRVWPDNTTQDSEALVWDTVVDSVEENRYLSWHSVPGALADTSGKVSFEPLSKNRTRVHVEMMLNPPVKAGEFVDEFFGKQIEQMILRDLRTYKEMLESPQAQVTHTMVPTSSEEENKPEFSASKQTSQTSDTPLSVLVHGRVHEIRDKPAL